MIRSSGDSVRVPSRQIAGSIFDTAHRMLRFLLVGGLATFTHAFVSVGALHLLSVAPLVANGIGFLVAFSVSLAGHTFFTFRSQMSLERVLKFGLVAISAAAISSTIVLLADAYTSLSHDQILPLAAVSTPVFSYVCHSLWTFRLRVGKTGA
jgi:putative flippase GtrA